MFREKYFWVLNELAGQGRVIIYMTSSQVSGQASLQFTLISEHSNFLL